MVYGYKWLGHFSFSSFLRVNGPQESNKRLFFFFFFFLSLSLFEFAMLLLMLLSYLPPPLLLPSLSSPPPLLFLFLPLLLRSLFFYIYDCGRSPVPLPAGRPPRWPSGKASTSRAEGPGFESRLRRDFFGVESYQWLKHWHSSGYPARRLAL